MSRRLTSHASLAGFVLGVLATALWTWLTFSTQLFARLDATSGAPHLVPASAAGQYWAAFAIITQPGFVVIGLLLLAGWAWQRRLRNLCNALLVGCALTWPLVWALKHLLRRARPESAFEQAVTHSGWAYPSGHAAMMTLAAAMVITATTTTRQTRATVWVWRVLAVAAVLLVALCRWIMDAHWPTDIIGGALLGLTTACFALWVGGVHMIPELERPTPLPEAERRRAAVIYNPSKVFDRATFRRNLEWELEQRGWDDPLWLLTRPDDPGREMAREAIERGVDLVVVAGGDGTVRVVCSELANTAIPVAIVPAGTGNLLARNLGIPLDEPSALRVAFEGRTQRIDLVRVTVDGNDDGAEHFAVMAGIGIDARIMETTRPELKKTVGSAAYFVAAAQQVTSPPMGLTFQVDDQPPEHRRAMMAVVGNVGMLQAGIQLFPQASATDGRLDLIVASPRRITDWATMTARVLARRSNEADLVDELAGHRVRIEVDEQMPYELDGDTEGHARVFEAEVVPGALAIRLPH